MTDTEIRNRFTVLTWAVGLVAALEITAMRTAADLEDKSESRGSAPAA